jgi:TolB-like protein
VLPLLSLGGDSLQRDLADGLSDDVATALFRVPGVRVMNRRSVGRYRGQRDID